MADRIKRMAIKLCWHKNVAIRFDNGSYVRCTLERGHEGDHFNSFAMRMWR